MLFLKVLFTIKFFIMKKLFFILVSFFLIQITFSQSTINPDSVCLNSNAESYWFTPNIGSSYFWPVDPAIGVLGTVFDPVTNTLVIDWSGVIAGYYSDAIIVVETDANGCDGEVRLDVVVLDLPSAPNASDVVVCENNFIPDLIALGSGNLTWYDSNNNLVWTGSPFVHGLNVQGTYSFTVFDDLNGCVSTPTQVDLIIYPIPNPGPIQHN